MSGSKALQKNEVDAIDLYGSIPHSLASLYKLLKSLCFKLQSCKIIKFIWEKIHLEKNPKTTATRQRIWNKREGGPSWCCCEFLGLH